MGLSGATKLCGLIEQHAHDSRQGGYIEVLAEDWSPAGDLRLSDKDMDVAKSMNNHLHILALRSGSRDKPFSYGTPRHQCCV